MITRNNLSEIPTNPGCYLFKDEKGKVLYVGKAKHLRKRVSSYFQKKDHEPKTLLLVRRIHHIDFIVTKNEVEALLLENNLIKTHYPRYNIDLKDSRRYAYLRITKDEYPYLEIARMRDTPGEYFGPFISGRMRTELHKLLTRRFGILDRKPSKLKLKSLNKEEYKEKLKFARQILKGNVNDLIEKLTKEMDNASKKQNYEHALNLRTRINSLGILKDKQDVELRRSFEADIINYAVTENRAYLLIFNVYKGILENKQQFEFDHHETSLEEFLVQYYTDNDIPKEIIVPQEIDQMVVKFLNDRRGKEVKVHVPLRGSKKALLDLALKNVILTFFGEREKLIDLQEMIKMKELPRVIECFDISHLSGTHTTASMVTFRDGKPDKDNYRRFKIRTVHDGDDFEAMKEVVRRRYFKVIMGNLPMPDLVVIDGGIGQLGAAQTVFRELGLRANVISLAKKLEEIYLPGRKTPLRHSHKRKGLQLLQAARDEAHRFAVSYNRLLRKKHLKD